MFNVQRLIFNAYAGQVQQYKKNYRNEGGIGQQSKDF